MHARISFEKLDIANKTDITLDSFAGLTWTNFFAYDPANDPRRLPEGGIGYFNGLTSGKQEAFSARDVTAHISVEDGAFDLKRGYLTAVYVPNDTVTVVGSRDGVEVFHMTVDINEAAPTLVQFGFTDIDDVAFTSTSGKQVVFDDLVFGGYRPPLEAPLARAFAHHAASAAHDAPTFHAHLPQPDLIQLA